jgi:hypothetical protein
MDSINIKTNLLKFIDKIIIKDNRWRILGSFSRNELYHKDIRYVTDIDITNYTDERKWDVVKNLVYTNIPNLKFTHLTFYVHDENFKFDIDIINKDNFGNIDFKKIHDKINKLKEDGVITAEIANLWISYIDKPTLKSLLLFMNDVDKKKKIKCNLNNIESGFIEINNKKYDIKELCENLDNHLIIHWLWEYPNNFIPIDVGIMSKKHMIKFVKSHNINKKTFYKNVYLNYYLEEWYYLFRNLYYVCKDFNLLLAGEEIRNIADIEFGLHKALLSKLKIITKYIKNEKKYSNIDVKLLISTFNSLKPIMKEIGYDISNEESDYEKVYRDFSLWFNKKMIPFYNEWRQILVNMRSEIDNLIP